MGEALDSMFSMMGPKEIAAQLRLKASKAAEEAIKVAYLEYAKNWTKVHDELQKLDAVGYSLIFDPTGMSDTLMVIPYICERRLKRDPIDRIFGSHWIDYVDAKCTIVVSLPFGEVKEIVHKCYYYLGGLPVSARTEVVWTTPEMIRRGGKWVLKNPAF